MADPRRMSLAEIDTAIAKRMSDGDEDGAALISAIVQRMEETLAHKLDEIDNRLFGMAIMLQANNLLAAMEAKETHLGRRPEETWKGFYDRVRVLEHEIQKQMLREQEAAEERRLKREQGHGA